MALAPRAGQPFDPVSVLCYNHSGLKSLGNRNEPEQEYARMAENGATIPAQGEPPAVEASGTAPTSEAGQGAEQNKNVWKTVGIILGVLVFVLVISALFYGLMTHPVFTSVLRDVAIIVLALVTMITSILLAVLLFQLQSLIVLLRDEIQPILASINQTTSTVRGTTTFVSDAVVAPVIKMSGYVSGVRQAAKIMFGGSAGQRASSQTAGQKADVSSSEPASPMQDFGVPDQQS